jgi:AcrR family transcriptional regulator
MPYQGRTKDEVVSEFRRGQILDAAHAVFAGKGFREATVCDIAEAAGVAKGTVYLYFKSKDEMYWAALERGLDQLHAQTKAALDQADTVEQTLRAFVGTKVRFFDAHREFFRIYFAEFGKTTPHHVRAQKEFERRYLEQVALLDAALQKGARAGAIRRSVLNGAGFSVFAITHSVVTRRVRGWSRGPLDADVEAVIDLLWRGLATDTHA